MKKILLIIFTISSVLAYSQETIVPDTLSGTPGSSFETENMNVEITKEKADSAYINNDFTSAIELYENLLKEKGESPTVYYNLGNSYYKTENIAKAILNYERALLLNPGDNDIRFNLEMAQAKAVDKVIPINDIFFVSWFKSLANTMSVDAWANMAVICFILLLIGLSIFIFSKRSLIKKIGFIAMIALVVIVVMANVFANYQKNLRVDRKNAIIMAPSVTVRSTPNENGTELFILHEGHKVNIKDDSMREWKEISIEDGNVGWIPVEMIERI